MPKSLLFASRGLLSGGCVLVALLLMWYGTCLHRMEGKDPALVSGSGWTELFSTTWLWRGNRAFYRDLDPAGAMAPYREAVRRNVLNVDAWMRLARAAQSAGETAVAGDILEFLSDKLSEAVYWKWRELLLAHELGLEEYFAHCFNFILSRLGHRTREAVYMAQRHWGDWMQVLPHVNPSNYSALLNVLMQEREAAAAVALWERYAGCSPGPPKDEALRFIDFLLRRDRIPEAERIWSARLEKGLAGMHNAGFESEPLGTAFGWRLRRDDRIVVERTSRHAYEGRYSLHVHFTGEANVVFRHVSRIIPVEPGAQYELSFARKAAGLTTDQGVYAKVSGHRCQGARARTEPVTGSCSWEMERLSFAVPSQCRAVVFQLRRDESLKFDNKISGDYWLDGVRLDRIDD